MYYSVYRLKMCLIIHDNYSKKFDQKAGERTD